MSVNHSWAQAEMPFLRALIDLVDLYIEAESREGLSAAPHACSTMSKSVMTVRLQGSLLCILVAGIATDSQLPKPFFFLSKCVLICHSFWFLFLFTTMPFAYYCLLWLPHVLNFKRHYLGSNQASLCTDTMDSHWCSHSVLVLLRSAVVRSLYTLTCTHHTYINRSL